MAKRSDQDGLVKAGQVSLGLELTKGTGLVRVGDLVRPDVARLKPPGPVAARLMRAQVHIRTGEELGRLWSHSAFCQLGLPYRDPGDDVREWERVNGGWRFKIIAGEAMHPETGEFVPVPLPWGRTVRIVQICFDTQAIQRQSPLIETDRSLTRFVAGTLKLDPHGRNIRRVKDALASFSASTFRIGIKSEKGTRTINTSIVEDFDIWFPKNDQQRVLWPAYVKYSPAYYENLLEHAVPLLESAVAALSHSALCLDIYRWLAQRLHRIPPKEPLLLYWNVLHEQFGWDIARLANFRRIFTGALSSVLSVYPEAQGKVYADSPAKRCNDGRGLWLHHAQPPVRKQQILIP